MVLDSRQAVEACHRAEGQDKVVESQGIAGASRAMAGVNFTLMKVYGLHLTVPESDFFKKSPDGCDDMFRLDAAGGYLRQHGSDQEIVVPIDESDIYVLVSGKGYFQTEGRIDSIEPPAEYKNASVFAIFFLHDG